MQLYKTIAAKKSSNNNDSIYLYQVTAPNGRNADAQHNKLPFTIYIYIIHARAVTRVIEFPRADEHRETKPIKNHNSCIAELQRRERARLNPQIWGGGGNPAPYQSYTYYDIKI